ncbi:UV radiation resistance associated protein [Acipenser ruthenus]|uniref:UV radiation resistance associated protein n=1 Tax=Acipenser ruthenus TaxID=7906 RepID=A0A444V6T1_ACIRT|nr:UV radiation resistance associated protein [Acipenser ruthenus]
MKLDAVERVRKGETQATVKHTSEQRIKRQSQCAVKHTTEQRIKRQTRDDGSVAVALGYTAHIVLMISYFLQVPLRYPVVHKGSRSSIKDNITDQLAEKERELVTCLVLVSMFHSLVTVSIAQGNNAGEDFGKLEEGNRTDQSD